MDATPTAAGALSAAGEAAGAAAGRIVLLGSGNVATHLGAALAGRVVQVWSRTEAHARRLAQQVGAGCTATADIDALAPDADLYIMAVSDDAIAPLAQRARGRRGVWVHTSGTTAAAALDGVGDAHGVLYPLMTFTREARLDMARVPVFVEATTAAARAMLRATAHGFTPSVYEADSQRRRRLHIAAVYACNFANYMWLKASEMLVAEGLTLDLFAPMIEAALDKALTIGPEAGQTGPARRGDSAVVAAHQAMLPEGDDRKLYAMLSQAIFSHFNPTTPPQQ